MRVHATLPEPSDPWRWLGVPELGRGFVAAWSRGDGGLEFTAFGAAEAVSWQRAPETSARAPQCSGNREQVVDIALDATVPPPVPLRIGGAAGGARPPGGPWSGWPANAWWTPSLVVARTGDRTTVTATGRATDRDVAEVAARLTERVRRLGDDGLPPAATSGGRAARSLERRDRAPYEALVTAARDTVRAGLLDKLVVARAAELRSREALDPIATAWALRRGHAGCATFLLAPGDGSAFVGATPELLVRRSGRRIETMALAGTAAVGRDADETAALTERLLASAKDRHEHAVVTAAIREALAPLARELIVAPTPHVRRLASVLHLETPIAAVLEADTSLEDLAATLHPTPAIVGRPRREASRWLRSHEDLERGWYAAPLGWQDAGGDGELVIALRSALLRGRSAWAFAGAGIVGASEPRAEYDETELKLRAIREALREAPQTGSGPGLVPSGVSP